MSDLLTTPDVILASFRTLIGDLSSSRSQSQTINTVVSCAMTVVVIIALTMSMNWVPGAFGLWAIFSGLFYVAAIVRRWKTNGGQWALILSGGQSTVAGASLIDQAQMPEAPSTANIAGYAGLSAFYLLISAVWLTMSEMRVKKILSSSRIS